MERRREIATRKIIRATLPAAEALIMRCTDDLNSLTCLTQNHGINVLSQGAPTHPSYRLYQKRDLSYGIEGYRSQLVPPRTSLSTDLLPRPQVPHRKRGVFGCGSGSMRGSGKASERRSGGGYHLLALMLSIQITVFLGGSNGSMRRSGMASDGRSSSSSLTFSMLGTAFWRLLIS